MSVIRVTLVSVSLCVSAQGQEAGLHGEEVSTYEHYRQANRQLKGLWRMLQDRMQDSDSLGGVLQSIDRYSGNRVNKYPLIVTFVPGKNPAYKIAFEKHGHTSNLYELMPYESFLCEGDTLYITEYHNIAPGCEVVAYQLEEGRELWRTSMHHKQPLGASGYFTNVQISFGGDMWARKGLESDRLVFVVGSESFCEYAEVLDADTGNSLALWHYRVGFSANRGEGIDQDGIPLPHDWQGGSPEPSEGIDQSGERPPLSPP